MKTFLLRTLLRATDRMLSVAERLHPDLGQVREVREEIAEILWKMEGDDHA